MSVSNRVVWITLAVAFAALNVWAVASAGLEGIVAYLSDLGPIGVVATVDLVLALIVGLTFVVRDARARRVDARPFVVLTLGTGSLGLLAYLGRHDESARDRGWRRLPA
jgi:hypothetical protein